MAQAKITFEYGIGNIAIITDEIKEIIISKAWEQFNPSDEYICGRKELKDSADIEIMCENDILLCAMIDLVRIEKYHASDDYDTPSEWEEITSSSKITSVSLYDSEGDFILTNFK